MSAQVINITSGRCRIVGNYDYYGPIKAEVIVTNSKPHLKVEENDDALIFYGYGLNFSHVGNIISESQTSEAPFKESVFENTDNTTKDKYYHKFEIDVQPLNCNLYDYKYSLLSVSNYEKPERHFMHSITHLNENDFETIVRRQIYLSRTTFGYLFQALPLQDQVEVVQALLMISKRGNIRLLGFTVAMEVLMNYVEHNIISSGKLLRAAHGTATQLNLENLETNKLGFKQNEEPENDEILSWQEPAATSTELIEKQVERFVEFHSTRKEFDVMEVMTELVKNNRSIEERFNKLFANKEWPLSIII